jgi:putative flippase GtrA
VVPREFAGYMIISLVTFVVDMGLLTLLRHRIHLPVPVAVAISYAVGFTLNYILNRTLNFQSHAPVAGQLMRYSVVAAGDFAATVGVTSGLVGLGLALRASRLIAGAFIGLLTFFLYRWWVFRR